MPVANKNNSAAFHPLSAQAAFRERRSLFRLRSYLTREVKISLQIPMAFAVNLAFSHNERGSADRDHHQPVRHSIREEFRAQKRVSRAVPLEQSVRIPSRLIVRFSIRRVDSCIPQRDAADRKSKTGTASVDRLVAHACPQQPTRLDRPLPYTAAFHGLTTATRPRHH